MRKIITRMRGGLGNQLFIVSYALYIANQEINREECEIILDIREYKHYKIRNFELFNLIMNDKMRFYDSRKDFSIFYELTRSLYHVVQKMFRPDISMNTLLQKKGLYYSKRSVRPLSIPLKQTHRYLYGYFQDANMALKVKDELLCRLLPQENTSYDDLTRNACIAVSIRCGKDYLDQGWPICCEDYYLNSLSEILEEKYKNKNVSVLIFSDNMEYAKKISWLCNVTYIQNLSPSDQIRLMSRCNDFVISNSSFSWWGAFLGSNSESIIIAPDQWYDDGEKTERTFLKFPGMRIRKM